MEKDRTVRRLTALEQSASSARVLNLSAIHRKNPADPALIEAPFFSHRLLDRSIILKHRLRPHEYSMFATPKPTATKLLIPIDNEDLRAGAHYAFVGQRDFDEVVQSMFGKDFRPGSRDRIVLDLIDSLPSLDPFLLREQLRRHDIEPARVYFGITDADIQRMFEFVRGEIASLVALSSQEGSSAATGAGRLVEKLLSSRPEDGFEPLKVTLKLSDKEYLDGVFAWRGFLYYKWQLEELRGVVGQVAMEIAAIAPRGPRDPDATQYLPGARQRIHNTVGQALSRVQALLDVYNKAYAGLTEGGKPMGFRDFLLTAPSMFTELGECLGGIQHIISFWRYRFPPGKARMISPAELMDVFLDFEDSLMTSSSAASNAWVV
ncbi:hypothetical protein GGQ61_003682 [Phenylobacterium haematophilum]|uniref:Uncharacterized protein n=1 Tax=Phenylobacterium haematophilum TaxID=98513 RepID=A0A840A3Q5_9CAUL|nr:hypothetical protein [Phenylobacterium haematophilum]MBB3892944.1 hypothetical protein [Phenylobacterium haematophilum]